MESATKVAYELKTTNAPIITVRIPKTSSTPKRFVEMLVIIREMVGKYEL